MNNKNSLKELYPNNSEMDKGKGRARVKKEVAMVAQGRVAPEKKSLGGKFAETFFAGSLANVWEYLLMDTIIPGMKHAIEDFTRLCLYGDARGERYRMSDSRERTKVWTSYDSISTSRSREPRERGRRDEPADSMHRATSNSRSLVEDVLFDYESSAKEVLGDMICRCQEYDAITVYDYYGIVGIKTDFTKKKYGWYERDMEHVEIFHTRDGWIMRMPRPVILED